MDSVLEEIRQSELNTGKQVESAQKRSEFLIKEAREASIKSEYAEKERLEKEAGDAIAKRRAELEQKKRKLLEPLPDKLAELEKKSKKNMKRAVDAIITKFEEVL